MQIARLIGRVVVVNTEKRHSLNIGFSGVGGKAHAFSHDRLQFEPTFCQKKFFFLFISYITSERHLFKKRVMGMVAHLKINLACNFNVVHICF